MSTKTTFKRIALVAVAALGLGVLSVAPSSAVVSNLTVTGVNGTSTNSSEGYVSDSTTAATVTISALLDTTADSITVAFTQKSIPATASGTPGAFMYLLDTTTPTASSTVVETATAVTAARGGTNGATVWTSASDTTTGIAAGTSVIRRISHTSTGYVGAKFGIQLDSTTTRVGGSYVYTVVVKAYSAGASNLAIPAQTVTQDVTIVVPSATSASTVVDPSKSSATVSQGATWSGNAGTDSAVSVLATASSTVRAVIRVINNNASNAAVAESITVTVTGPGVVRDTANTSVSGKSLVIVGDGNNDIDILSDGTAGTASIVVKTTSVTYAAKSVTFYAASASTAAASANKPVIAVGSNSSVVAASLKDANGAVWGGTAYIWAASAADALIAGSETPAACSFVASISAHLCDVAGKLAGTANFVVADSDSKTATTTVKSNSVAVRVSTGVPTTVKLAFDKATYSPGEKAQVWVTAVDAAGLPLAAQTITNLFAAGGITASTSLGSASDTLTSTSIELAGATSATDGTVAGYKVYTVYMPLSSGDVTISATGGTGVALAGRVAVSATATVVNASVDAATDAANEATDAANAATDAALAAADAADAATAAAQDASDAVAALSASVSKMISNLRAQITSLTNLVIKIQKKVRA